MDKISKALNIQVFLQIYIFNKLLSIMNIPSDYLEEWVYLN